jgi:hypothetical protein
MLIFIVVLSCTSCQRCFECKLYENGQLKDTESFCGSNEEANELEAAGYTCSAK